MARIPDMPVAEELDYDDCYLVRTDLQVRQYATVEEVMREYAAQDPRKVLNWLLDKPFPASECGLSKDVRQAKLEYYNELLVQIQNKIEDLAND